MHWVDEWPRKGLAKPEGGCPGSPLFGYMRIFEYDASVVFDSCITRESLVQ